MLGRARCPDPDRPLTWPSARVPGLTLYGAGVCQPGGPHQSVACCPSRSRSDCISASEHTHFCKSSLLFVLCTSHQSLLQPNRAARATAGAQPSPSAAHPLDSGCRAGQAGRQEGRERSKAGKGQQQDKTRGESDQIQQHISGASLTALRHCRPALRQPWTLTPPLSRRSVCTEAGGGGATGAQETRRKGTGEQSILASRDSRTGKKREPTTAAATLASRDISARSAQTGKPPRRRHHSH